MRRGFWKELDTTFKASIEMVGGTYPPDLMADEIEHRKALHKEVRTALKMWENQTKATTRALADKPPAKKAAR